MILESLELENFRQFIGKNAIEFSTAPQNTTIIFGENGRGKTGIYRAVMFCLFGDSQLSQDEGKGNVLLVNTTAAQLGAAKGETTQAVVRLTFTHDDSSFAMERVIKASLSQNKQTEIDSSVSLTITKNGNTDPIESPREIQDHINNIIDSRVKEFFLFDGEKIETLTRASETQQKNIGKAVKQILNIDSLKIAIDGLERVKKAFDKEVQYSAKGDYGKYLAERSGCEERIDELSTRIEEIENEAEKAQQRKEKLEFQLKQYEGIDKKMEEVQSLATEVENLKQELDTQRGAFPERIKCLVPYLCFAVANEVFLHINSKWQNKEIPGKMRIELIEELIEKRTCICGRSVENPSSEFDSLKQWLSNISEQQPVDDSAIELWHQLDRFDNPQRIRAERTNAHNALTAYHTTKKKIDDATDKQKEIIDEIGDSGREDVRSFAKQREKCEKDIVGFRAEVQNADAQIEELRIRIRELDDLISKEEKEKSLRGVNQNRRDLAEQAKNILEEVHQHYISDIRQRISRTTEDNLRLFLDEESQNFFSKVEVDEKYALQIFDKFGNRILGDISAGQRQLLSLAFITALAQTASNNKLFQMPLFMDTPFGRLSLDHRRNLIKRIPTLCAQWILLATDTELRREEAQEIRDTESLGNFYRLISTDDGSTKIELYDSDRALELLHQGKEVTI